MIENKFQVFIFGVGAGVGEVGYSAGVTALPGLQRCYSAGVLPKVTRACVPLA